MKVNLHTHTARCYHAAGTDEEYVLAALEAGYGKLGFADHTPFPYKDDYFPGDKMKIGELEGYIESVRGLKEKYKDKIEILLGLECEVVPEFYDFLWDCHDKMDFLILGNHGDKRVVPFMGKMTTIPELEYYTALAIEGMETGLFLYLCHPDLMFNRMTFFDDACDRMSREICRTANRLGIPLEYNLLGLQKTKKPGTFGYPCQKFWEIAAEENVTAVIGVDAHSPQHLLTFDMEGPRAMLKEMGITVLDDPMTARKR